MSEESIVAESAGIHEAVEKVGQCVPRGDLNIRSMWGANLIGIVE